jgi:hypothetical protein
MKKSLSIRFNGLIKTFRRWFRKYTRNEDDNDWFDHPYAIF